MSFHLSHLPAFAAGIGTLQMQVAGLHRARPSVTLDKAYLFFAGIVTSNPDNCKLFFEYFTTKKARKPAPYQNILNYSFLPRNRFKSAAAASSTIPMMKTVHANGLDWMQSAKIPKIRK